jgi:hypothetical protein
VRLQLKALVALAALGCGGAAATPGATVLAVDADFAAPATLPAGLSVATAQLHLVSLVAVSDRSSSDARARVAELDLPMAGTAAATLAAAPPGLYSGLAFVLGDGDAPGIDIEGTVNDLRLHVTLAHSLVYATCPDPLQLDPGGRVMLSLHADPSGWFDGVDLSTVMQDSDDNGVLISDDDNAALAARILANARQSFILDCAPAPAGILPPG